VTFVGPLPPISGGIAQHSSRLVRAIAECDADPQLVSWISQYPRLLHKGGGMDPAAPRRPDVTYLMRWWDPTSWVRAGRIARSGDLLVMPWWTPVHAPPLRVIARTARVPLTLVVHNALPHEHLPFDKQLARGVMRSATHVVVHAQVVADAVHELAPDVPVTVVPHPPSIDFAATPLPARPPLRLLCMGYVREYKGFDVAVEAVRLLREQGVDVQLTIAGEVWKGLDDWERRVADPRLGNDVELIARYVGDDELAELLSSHHIVVAPYRAATQSGIVPMAFAAGRPVVATNVGGLRESVTDGVNGLLVEPDDAPAVAAAVQRLAAGLDDYANGAAATSWSWLDVARAVLTPLSSRRA
jgi:glycosyltransferase involved in cell wall biosynthesis